MANRSETDSPAPGLQSLFPQSQKRQLKGLYLCSDLRRHVKDGDVFVYSNFITSLDGRIAISPTICRPARIA